MHYFIRHYQHHECFKEFITYLYPETLNKANNQGQTPVQLAIQHGKLEMAKDLVDAGVDLKQTDNDYKGLVEQVHAARDKGYINHKDSNQFCRYLIDTRQRSKDMYNLSTFKRCRLLQFPDREEGSNEVKNSAKSQRIG